ncbi:MAG: Protein GrpE [Candidatus Magasanikbacteria bacterium GW2011_GWC2_37_14]|uniref:Protein GrpE n=1 Tax=Candidatus Magasanikbacteria bacterium GW2011_GWC2_37_14 TaxID=1619046 RepID=A0A0G0IVR0_9BACT|nr:MAG: Protein GrpE [Candidatus Magasanikbacteria bacterium GW2011_GWC2_37_14]
MPDENKKYPKICSGVIIINNQDKVFLMKGERFEKKWHIPGGHEEWGEKMTDCVIREVKEETNLNVYNPEFIRPVEFIFDKTYNPERHIIAIDFVVKTDDAEDNVKLDNREGFEYTWLTENQIKESKNIEKLTKETLGIYFNNKNEKEALENYKAGWQRAQADYQNLKKEIEDMRGEWVRYSEQQILEDFIPVYDNFKKAFAVETQNLASLQNDNWKKGIEYIMKQFWKVMQDHNVEEIKTVGELFDPNLHEAVAEAHEPEPEGSVQGKEWQEGVIVKEVEAGYIMKGKVIKVAKVIVAKTK